VSSTIADGRETFLSDEVSVKTGHSPRLVSAKYYPPIDAENMSEQDITRQLVSLLELQIHAFPEQWWLWQALPFMWQE